MKKDEKGIALIITMFLLATLSALSVSMMFLAQTETSSSRNYRTMSQARYAAEAGVHEMTNYLINSGFAPTANVDTTKSPVTCTGGSCAHTGTCASYATVAAAVANGCVVLGYSTATTNNPTASVHAPSTLSTLAVNGSGATTNAAQGTVTFSAAAILLSQKSLTPYGSSTPRTLQTWYIISDGMVPPSTSAIVEVSATMEQVIGQAETFAVFATNPNCSAITLSGGGSDMTTDSYSSQSSDMATNPPTHTGVLGGIGTNGNLNVSGGLTIGGKLTTPRTGSGACSNSNPNAITGTGHWSYQGTTQVAQALTYPTPEDPSPMPPSNTSVTISSGATGIATCNAAVVASGWTCATGSPSSVVVLTPPAGNAAAPLVLGNVTVGSNTTLQIAGGNTGETINVNSFSLGSNAQMTLATGTNVTMAIAGNSLGSTPPLDLSGGGSVNTTGSGAFDPYRLQITYAGTAQINLVGTNAIAATIYAPNAALRTVGHGDFYGSVLSNTFTDTGGASIHYDTSLSTKFTTLGNHVLTSFSWKKY
jgi:Tfp pilus assembly protein PilX